MRELNISHHTGTNTYGFIDDYFQSADIGQEFVISPSENLTIWTKELIERN